MDDNYLIPLLSFSVFVVFILGLFCVCEYFNCREEGSLFLRWFDPNPPLPPRLAVDGLDPVIVRSLPLVPYDGKELGYCVVCLYELEKNESARMIPACGHVFHPECVDRWLVNSARCPVCRSIQIHADVVITRGSEDGSSTVARQDARIKVDREEASSSCLRRTGSCSSLEEEV